MLPASEITASPAVFVLDFYRKPPVFMLLPDIFCPERRYSYLIWRKNDLLTSSGIKNKQFTSNRSPVVRINSFLVSEQNVLLKKEIGARL